MVMKFKYSTNRLVNATIIIVVIFLVIQFYFLFTHTSMPMVNYDSDTYTVNNLLKPIDPMISTDLPYNKYLELERNVQRRRALKNGEWLGGSGSNFGWFMATTDGQFCDTCSIKNYTGIEGIKQSYLKLPGWQIRPSKREHYGLVHTEFYVEHGQSYVRKFVTTKVKKTNKGHHYTVNQIDEPVKFRYNSNDNCIMIPVSASVKDTCTAILMVCGILLFIYILYLIAAFLKFIIDVSKGLSFTTSNVNRLKLIAFSLLGFPVAMFLLTLLSRLLFHSYFTDDVMLNSDVWSKSWPGLCAGFVFLLLFKAFRQGKALKEENELTV
jgi:hypothetical protein